MKRNCFPFAFLIPLAVVLGGCAAQLAHHQGMALIADGKSEEGLVKLEQATRAAPDELEYRVHYLNARDKVIARLFAEADRDKTSGRFDEAEAVLHRIQAIERNNAQAAAGLIALDQARRHARLLDEANKLAAANDYGAAAETLGIILQENPQQAEARTLLRQIQDKAQQGALLSPALGKAFKRPVTMEFRDANLKQVLEALSRHSGLNFVLDKEVPANLMITTFLRQASVEDALDVILSTNGLDKRILNDTTLLIYPDTAAKQSEHQDLVVRTFYLANADAKDVLTMLKAVLKAKNLYVDEKLNLLIMRDTAPTIALAERLVAAQDVSDPEVMLDVEVLEVQRSKLLNLGIQFPDQLTLTPLSAGSSGSLTLDDLKHLSSSTTGVAITPAIINLQDQINDSNILANPRIRTHNREKAEIKIGDRVPIITTTSTSTGFVSNSVQYVDVGLKLNVEPTIYPDDQVAIRLSLEVSSVVKEITSKDGTTVYQIGSRNASTMLRLKDGETQILGGLINDNDTKAANRFPGLGDFPILGRLFASQKDNTQKTELVLSITPHLVRSLAPPLLVPAKYWSGTENNPRLKPLANISTTGDEPAAESSDKLLTTKAAPLNNAAAAHPVMLRWEGPSQARVGETFKLVLKASGEQAIAGFPLQIKYDATALEAVDVTPGGFMAQGEVKADFTKRIIAGAGMIFVTQNRGVGDGAKGEGDLIEVTFRALKPVQNGLITALPTVPLAPGNQPMRQTGPTMVGVSVTP